MGVLLLALPAGGALADVTIPIPTTVTLPPISLGAGMRTSFIHTDAMGAVPTDASCSTSTPDGNCGQTDANRFSLDSVRLYLSGSATPQFKFTFNTEYSGSPPGGTNSLVVMDAIGRFEYSDQFNIWVGRFLPPSDRSNLYGPYYANDWAVYQDGVQDGYASASVGRQDGAAYWGQFGIVKVSAGVFDAPSATGTLSDQSKVLSAARVLFDFWDPEPGYYLNGTYYGEKDILALGFAGETMAKGHDFSADLLLEKKLADAGTFSLESEYTRYDRLAGYGGFDGSYTDSNGYYGLVSYLFPQQVGIGKFQLLGKYGRAKFDDSSSMTDVDEYAQRTAEFDLNYVIKTFNARISMFYKGAYLESGLPDEKQVGIGLQLQI